MENGETSVKTFSDKEEFIIFLNELKGSVYIKEDSQFLRYK